MKIEIHLCGALTGCFTFCVVSYCSDAQMCMHYIAYWGGRNHIAFIGDSRIRQLYFEFVNLLSKEIVEGNKMHSDMHYSDEKISAKVVGTFVNFV
jgi:hypothetical protein